MRLPHRLQGQKVKSQRHGAGAYCGGHLAAQLVRRRLGPFSSVFRRLDSNVITIIIFIIFFFFFFFVVVPLLVVVAVVVVVNMSTRSTPHVVALPSVDGRRGCRVICWQTRAVQGGPEKTFLGADDDLAWTDAVNTLAHTRRRFCSTINTTTPPSQAAGSMHVTAMFDSSVSDIYRLDQTHSIPPRFEDYQRGKEFEDCSKAVSCRRHHHHHFHHHHHHHRCWHASVWRQTTYKTRMTARRCKQATTVVAVLLCSDCEYAKPATVISVTSSYRINSLVDLFTFIWHHICKRRTSS